MSERTFREYRCRLCGTISKGDVDPTLSPSIVLAYCVACKKRVPAEDLGEAPTPRQTLTLEVAVTDVEALLGPGDRFWIGDPGERRIIDRGEALSALESGEDGGTIARVDLEVEARRVFAEDLLDDHIQAAYLEWRRTQEGIAVVEAIRRRAVELRRRGWRHYGIKALGEVVRFDRALSIGPDAEGFKVNNSYLSRLARDLMDEDPDLGGFFEVRELRAGGGS